MCKKIQALDLEMAGGAAGRRECCQGAGESKTNGGDGAWRAGGGAVAGRL